MNHNLNIALVYNKKLKPESEIMVKEAVEFLKKSCNVKVNPKYFDDTDVIVIYGGDGYLLNVANKVSYLRTSIVGVNLGRVGYLCGIQKEKHINRLNDILHDNYYISNRTRISAKINEKNEIDALNEISIGGINRTVYLELKFITDRKYLLKSIGDGIVFSTRTGSTAYNVNAGGSVILNNELFSVVANNAIFQSDILPMNTKSIVVNTETRFEVKILNKNRNNIPFLIADGQRTIKLDKDDIVTIEKSINVTKLIMFE